MGVQSDAKLRAAEEGEVEAFPGMKLEMACGGKVAIFSVVGELPAASRATAAEFLNEILKRGCRHVVGDLSRATRISSTGIGMLAYYRKMLEAQGGRIVLVKPPPEVLRQLEAIKLSTWIGMHDTRDAALAAVTSR